MGICAVSETQKGKVQFVFRSQFSIFHSFIMGIYRASACQRDMKSLLTAKLECPTMVPENQVRVLSATFLGQELPLGYNSAE